MVEIQAILEQRSGAKCELCGTTNDLCVHPVDADQHVDAPHCVMICETCRVQIESPEATDSNHWRCLNECIWSEIPAVQVVAWRMLNRLRSEGWPQELLEQVSLADGVQQWAESALVSDDAGVDPTLDSNGTALSKGDTVTLIKDLVVKGGGFTAKRGTTVKNIALTSNPKHVEGRVSGTQIVLVAAYLKRVPQN